MNILALKELELKPLSKDDVLKSLKSDNTKELQDFIGDDREFIYTNNGKEAIRIVLEELNLTLEDEVYISTSTNTSYVATCVSATAFNYAKISRVLTEKTKLIYVIHTYGFFNKDIFKLRDIANERGIKLIEDCAFSFNSITNGVIHGTIGDYTIYSLPKIFPIEYGGILAYKNRYSFSKNTDKYLEEELNKWLPKLNAVKNKRQKNYNYLLNKINKKPIYGKLSDEDPFMFGFIDKDNNFMDTNSNDNIYKELSNKVEFGKTHVKNEVHIPTNFLIDDFEYDEIINVINKGKIK